MGNGVKILKMFGKVRVKMCNCYLYIGLQQNILGFKTPTNPNLKVSFEIRATWPQKQPLFMEDTQSLLLRQIRKN
jgi:hypothetical protein